MKKIDQFIDKFNVLPEYVTSYGEDQYKIDFMRYQTWAKKGKLILVTAITPTEHGEGKTTCSIGIADGLNALGYKALLALREPSMGPVFGRKGKATGGGECVLEPEEQINLHFTGDFHAISSANNLISAAIDSHLYWGNELQIDIPTITWTRCLDVNDRALRNVTLTIKKGITREEEFAITAASKMMTILSLASDLEDLRNRLEETIFAFDMAGQPLFLAQLNIVGAAIAILKEAIKPNLVFSRHNTPALVHCGPFANIATGTNSAIATDLALKLGEYVVTECGFGSELGFEKYVDVVNAQHDFVPHAVVLVATIRALKSQADFENNFLHLKKHIQNVQQTGLNLVVAINKFADDTADDLVTLSAWLEKHNLAYAINTSYIDGPHGANALAKEVVRISEQPFHFKSPVNKNASIEEKLLAIAHTFYHQTNVALDDKVREQITVINKLGYGKLPIVFAKSPNSIDGNDKNEVNYTLKINELKLNTGAQFILAQTNKVLLMPGLPKNGNFVDINVVDNKIVNIK